MEKINEAIQKLISVSPLVQNCYVSSSGQTASTDLLAHLVKSDNPWVNYAEYNKLKPYQHIILFGDALMSAVYTAYAYHSLHKDYGICPDVTLIHLDDIGNVNEAIRLFSKAIEGNKAYALAYFNLGRSYAILKENTVAAQYFQKALDYNILTEELDEEDIRYRLHKLFEV